MGDERVIRGPFGPFDYKKERTTPIDANAVLYYIDAYGCETMVANRIVEKIDARFSTRYGKYYYICIHKDKTFQPKIRNLVLNRSPKVSEHPMFSEILNMVVSDLDKGKTVHLIGLCYGGYIVSKVVHSLPPEKLQNLKAVTMGTPRLHTYKPELPMRHYIFKKDYVRTLHKQDYVRPDVSLVVSDQLKNTWSNRYWLHIHTASIFLQTINMFDFEKATPIINITIPAYKFANSKLQLKSSANIFQSMRFTKKRGSEAYRVDPAVGSEHTQRSTH
jgi:hypothetical protein